MTTGTFLAGLVEPDGVRAQYQQMHDEPGLWDHVAIGTGQDLIAHMERLEAVRDTGYLEFLMRRHPLSDWVMVLQARWIEQ